MDLVVEGGPGFFSEGLSFGFSSGSSGSSSGSSGSSSSESRISGIPSAQISNGVAMPAGAKAAAPAPASLGRLNSKIPTPAAPPNTGTMVARLLSGMVVVTSVFVVSMELLTVAAENPGIYVIAVVGVVIW